MTINDRKLTATEILALALKGTPNEKKQDKETDPLFDDSKLLHIYRLEGGNARCGASRAFYRGTPIDHHAPNKCPICYALYNNE